MTTATMTATTTTQVKVATMEIEAAASSFLFVPATRLDRVVKAYDSGASHVIIDLEDAVSDGEKDAVRQKLLAFDRGSDGATNKGERRDCRPYWLRINGAASKHYAADLALIAQLTDTAQSMPPRLCGLILPKVQNGLSVTALHQATKLPIIAAIEDARGLVSVADIASAKGLYALTYGSLDMMASLGVRLGSGAGLALADFVRSQLLIHSSVHGLHPPIETIYPAFDDGVGFGEMLMHWRDFGFGGQLLIHPRQVSLMHALCARPDDERRDFASKVLAVYEQTGQAAFAIDGQMVDLPVIGWAQRYLGKSGSNLR